MADPIDFSITKISSILSEPLVAHIQSVAEQKAFTKGEQIEQESHINALWISKTKARENWVLKQNIQTSA